MNDLIVTGGRIYPDADRDVSVEALLVQDGRVALAGTLADVRLAAKQARVHDLGAGTAFPGFADSHLHLLWYGLVLNEIDLFAARSLSDVRRSVQERVAAQPPGTWITGHGWQQENLAEQRMPTRSDLDDISPHHPVLLRRACGHIAVANTAALLKAGIGPDTPDPDGGKLGRDPEGELTGMLAEKAVELVAGQLPPPTLDDCRRALRQASARALAAGLTAVHTDDLRSARTLPGLLDVYRDVLHAGDVPLRVDLHIDWDYVDEAVARGLTTGADLGSEPGRFRLGGAKLFSDGSLGGRTAALREPYADDPSTSGLLVLPPDELARRAAAAAGAGFQVVIHAIGDRGAAVTLDALAHAHAAGRSRDAASPAVARPRLVHGQVLGPDLIERCRTEGVIVEIQPKFVTGDMHFAAQRVGTERLPYAYAWRSLLDAGVRCAGGSDCPIEPLDPLLGIWAAVCRQDMDGKPADGWLPDERLPLGQALALFTTGVAYANGTEHERGRLAPGYVADLTVLDRDPWHLPAAELRNVHVTQTIVGGSVAFAR